MIDVKDLATASGAADAERQTTIISKRVTVIKDKKRENRLLWGTATQITFFQEKKKKRTPVVVASHPWFSLEKLVLTPNNTAILTFVGAKPLEFTHTDLPVVAMMIRSHLLSFMKESELPEISGFQTVETAKGNGFIRLLNLLAKRKAGLAKDAASKYSSYFAKKPVELQLSMFHQISDYYSELLDCLFLEKEIVRLVVDVDVTPAVMKVLCGFMKTNTTVKELIFAGNLLESLDPLSQSFSFVITKIGFVKTELNQQNAGILKRLVNHTGITSLELVNCMDKTVAETFFDDLAKIEDIHLDNVSVKKVYGIPIDRILTVSCGVTKFVMSNCRIDITEVLEKISLLEGIEILDLSSNVAMLPIPEAREIPKSLRTLVLDDVQFTSKTLFQLFQFLRNVVNPIVLSLKDIGMSDSWGQFFDQCNEMDPIEISRLLWNKNRIDGPFLAFLSQIPHLSNLSLSGCLDRDPGCVASVISLIENTRSLKALDLSCESCTLTHEQIMELLISLVRNYSLTRLKLMGFKLTHVQLDRLTTTLLDNRRIVHIIYDFKDIITDRIIHSLERLCKRGIPLSFTPRVVPLILSHVDKEHKPQVERLIQQLAEGDRSIVPPEDSIRKYPSGGIVVRPRLQRKMSYDSTSSKGLEPEARPRPIRCDSPQAGQTQRSPFARRPPPVSISSPSLRMPPSPRNSWTNSLQLDDEINWPVRVDPLDIPPPDKTFDDVRQIYNIAVFIRMIRANS